MMLSQAASALSASLHGDDVLFDAVSKDTRTISSGDLYVAIKGERFDGHQFIDQAKASGAVAAMVSDCKQREIPQLCVDDTRLALGSLAAYWLRIWRNKITENAIKKVIGITGSNGKTTVKEMCRSIFSQAAGGDAVLSTQGNLNNDIGLPLTLLALREQHQYGVIEMGANHIGEIDYLSGLTCPDIAVISNAGSAHLEGFGSLQNVARAKAEIFNGLNKNGVAVINADDDFAGLWIEACADRNRLLFSMKDKSADIFATACGDGAYQFVTPDGDMEIHLPVPGRHNVMNALAATAVACAAEIDMPSIAAALNGFKNIAGRLNIKQLANGTVVIDDSYNANPASVAAAIDVLAHRPGRKILVLGDMAELGEDAEILHSQTGSYAKQSAIDVLYSTGKYGAETARGFADGSEYFAEKSQLIKHLLAALKGDETVLVKGSRSAAMEAVVDGLLNGNRVGKDKDKQKTGTRVNGCF